MYSKIKDNIGRKCLDFDLTRDCFSTSAQTQETIGDVITRISKTDCVNNIEWLDVLQFFSRRGCVPEFLREELLTQQMNDYIKYMAQTYNFEREPAFRLNATAKLNQRGV
jgi:hypothetical protein